MEPALKLNVMLAHPSYGGNGGVASEHPDIREWEIQAVKEMREDPRVGEIIVPQHIADTPITMVRNRFVCMARDEGAHVLLMVDSDQSPNLHAKESWFKPFWREAFDAIYDHYQRGPLVVGAPYCGPPNGTENVYVFRFQNYGIRGEETPVSLEQYTREEAAIMTGVQEVAALPTGMIMYDMRAFELIEPTNRPKIQILEALYEQKISPRDAEKMLAEGWFYYEWRDCTASRKASTEDVTNTRDIAFAGLVQLGYNPLRCAWDSWVGHWKPWNVAKPGIFGIDEISANFRRAVERANDVRTRMIDLNGRERLRKMGINAEIQVARPKLNGDIPQEVLDWFPEQFHTELQTRNVFGHRMISFLHMTPMEHLEALREIVSQYRRDRDDQNEKLIYLEVGSWLGDSAVSVADFADQIWCIDNWGGSDTDWTKNLRKMIGDEDNVYKLFEYNTRKFVKIYPFTADSTEAAKDQSEIPECDIVMIDADHHYESVIADIRAWLPKVKDSGIMIGHDYKGPYKGVAKAVHEVFGEDIVEHHGGTGGFWVVKMRDYLARLATTD